jgi:hypothetical protein
MLRPSPSEPSERGIHIDSQALSTQVRGIGGGAVVLSFMFQVAPASAYALMDCHMSSPHSSYGTTGGVTGQNATAIVNAANDWSETATPLIIYAGSSSSQFSVDAQLQRGLRWQTISSSL